MRKKQRKMKTKMCPLLDENCVKDSNEFKINRKQAEFTSSLESNSFALSRFKFSLLLALTKGGCCRRGYNRPDKAPSAIGVCRWHREQFLVNAI